MLRMFEVEFYGWYPTRIIFAKNRQEIWTKFPGIVRKIYRIEII